MFSGEFVKWYNLEVLLGSGPTILPIGYELIAWVAMVGPIMVIPLTAAYTLYDAKRRSRVSESLKNECH